MEAKLFIGNLPYSTTEEELRNLFSQAGNVASVSIIKDRDTGRSRGFAFIEMANQSEAENAIKMFNSYEMDNRPIKVNLARPREEHSGGGGGGGYGGGRSDRGGGSRDRDRRSGGGGTRRY